MDALNYNFKRSPVSVAVVNITFKDSYKNFSRSSPVQNAVGNGTESRAILDFNGTQYAVLSEPVVLDGDFEIEIIAAPSGDAFMQLLSGEGDTFNIRANDDLILVIDSSVVTEFSTYVERTKFNRIGLKRSGLKYTAIVNSQQDEFTASTVKVFSIETILGHTTYGTPSHFQGSPFSTRIWKNGDRFTGELVTDLRFDEPDTDYQRDVSKPVGAELVTNGDFSDGLSPFFGASLGSGSHYVDSGVLFLSGPDFNNRGEVRQYISGLNIGQTYKVRVNCPVVGASLVLLATSDTGGVDLNLISTSDGALVAGVNELHFVADREDYWVVLREQAGNSEIESISIREWSGAILENTLPGDWEEISKKSGDDFWLGQELLENGNFVEWNSDSDAESWNENFTSPESYVERVGNACRIVSLDGTYAHILQGSSLFPAGSYRFSIDVLEVVEGTGQLFLDTGLVNYSLPGFYEDVVTIDQPESLILKRASANAAADWTFTNTSFKRYLEYAEGAL